MEKSEVIKKNLMRISDIAQSAGVSVPTVHYYLREGLLTAPVKTSRNMAYYDPICVEEIKLIKEFQTERFLPLSMIKMILQAKREGQDAEHVVEMRFLLEKLFHPAKTEAALKELTFSELATATGVSESLLRTLEGGGLLMPVKIEGKQQYYDDIDVCIVQVVKKLMELGFTPGDFSVYRKYIEAIRNEAETMHARFHDLHTDKIPLSDLINALRSLKTYLATKIYRRTFLEFHK